LKSEFVKDYDIDEHVRTGMTAHVKIVIVANSLKCSFLIKGQITVMHFCTNLKFMPIVTVKQKQWGIYLSALLKGNALVEYSRLPVKDAQQY